MAAKIEPIKQHIGARVYVDPAEICDQSVVQRCLDMLEERGVLVFPKIGLTDAQQLAFTDALGTRVTYVNNAPGTDDGNKDIYKVTLDPKINPRPEYVQGTFFWHMDGISENIPPPKATLISPRRIAAKGGQTEFASTYAAYDNLSDADKAEFAGLRVLHSAATSLRNVMEEANAELDKMTQGHVREHPLVWTHKSGRKSLLIGSHADHVIGQPLANGRALLVRLLEWTGQPDFSYRHEWQAGDLVVWDNCGALHRVIPYDKDSGRIMHRTTIAGHEEVA